MGRKAKGVENLDLGIKRILSTVETKESGSDWVKGGGITVIPEGTLEKGKARPKIRFIPPGSPVDWKPKEKRGADKSSSKTDSRRRGPRTGQRKRLCDNLKAGEERNWESKDYLKT